MKQNNLPTYWAVHCDLSNPDWQKVIDYLNKTYDMAYDGFINGYYGYDGRPDVWYNIGTFRNNPTFLTIKEFVEMTDAPEYVECIKESCYNNYGKIGKIYQVQNWFHSSSDCMLVGTTSGSTAKNRFKPSTKEAFDKQNQVEEFAKGTYVVALVDGHALGKPEETMKTITYANAQRIVDVACTGWKETLFEMWGKKIVLKQDIEITEDKYQEMRKACTDRQHEIFDEIFGKDKPSFKVGDWVIGWYQHTPEYKTTAWEIGKISGEYIYPTKSLHRSHNTDIKHLRLATVEEIQKAKYIPKGTPCLVRDFNSDTWKFTYSLGNGKFQSLSGVELTWDQVQVLDMDNLPKY